MKRGKKAKKAQIMGLPFQFIFAVILIAVALFVGFFVIKMFLERAEQANINDFVKNQLTYEIQSIWSGPEEASVTKSLILSKNFEYVCFWKQPQCIQRSDLPPNFCSLAKDYATSTKENLFLVGKNGELGIAEKYDAFTAWYIKCGSRDCLQPFSPNPLCIPVVNGKVPIKFEKSSGSPNVTISKSA